MKTQLLTEFVCVATSGATVDNREISAQDLLDIAETYDPNKYTANIWIEHYRFSNLGQVAEVKAEKFNDENGVERVKLFARLSPSLELMQYNKRGQGLFTSIEFTPNFAQTGKSYLTGLAVTDSPASLHITQLNFSKRINDANVFCGSQEKLDLSMADNEEKGLFSRFLNWIKTENAQQTEFSANTGAENNQTENEDMDEKKLTAVITAAVAAAFSAQTAQAQQDQVANSVPAQQQTPQPAQPAEKPAEQAQTVSVEEFNQIKTQLNELTQKFNTALNTETTTVPHGANGISDNFTINTAV